MENLTFNQNSRNFNRDYNGNRYENHSKTMSRKIIMKMSRSLDKANVYTVPINNKPFVFSVMYHKMSPDMQYNFASDVRTNIDNDIHVRAYRNLDRSQFCKLFLKLNSEVFEITDSDSDPINVYTRDYRNVIQDISNDLIRDFREKTILNDLPVSKNKENYISIDSWRFPEINNEFVFIFLERGLFLADINSYVIRTAALQLATNNGLSYLVDKIDLHNETSYENDYIEITNDIIPMKKQVFLVE